MTEALRIDVLKSEARTFELLLKRYIDDRRFLTGHADHHLLYFIDSHDLSSFIDPKRLERPGEGFTLHAERLRPRASSKDAKLEIKLKNDQLMQDLVLDRDPLQVGLLPAHEEELQDDIDYQFRAQATKPLHLFQAAMRQVKTLMGDLAKRETIRRFGLRANAGPMTKAERDGVLEFLRAAAPAVLAVLWPRPDDTQARIDRLLDDSALRYVEDLDWPAYGYAPEAAERLRSWRPDPADIERWRKYLSSRRPRGSFRANRLDGEALAWVQGLNLELKKTTGPSTRVLLLTRAWSLTPLCNDAKTLSRFGLKPLSELRHPRLSVLKSSRQALQTSTETAEDAEQVLAVAMSSYRQQLDALPDDPEPTEMVFVEQAVDALVQALHEFEQTRFALNLRAGVLSENADVDAALRQILELFQSDQRVIGELRNQLLVAVNRFSQATVNMLRRRPPSIVARVSAAYFVEDCHRLTPLAGPLLVPLQLPSMGIPREATCTLETYFEQLAGAVFSGHGWTYLGWAFMLAAEGSPRAALVFCSGAEDIARIVANTPGALDREAVFLEQQIARLTLRESKNDSPSPGEILRGAEEQWPPAGYAPQDERWFFERALLRLELRLIHAETTQPEDWTKFTDDIALALERCQDAVARLGILSVALIGAMSLRGAHPGETQIANWHIELCRSMERLAHEDGGTREMLPLLARAMELVGYEIIGEIGRPTTGDAAERTDAQRVRIPAALRLEIGPIEELLEKTRSARPFDFVSLKAFDALDRISGRLQHHVQRDLIFAPIWHPSASEKVVGGIMDAPARAAAGQAYALLTRLTGASQRYGVFPRDLADLEKIEVLLRQALHVVEAAGVDGSASNSIYYLWMEIAYVRLLKSQLIPRDKRDEAHTKLARDYEAILDRFPDAAVAHFRLNVLYSFLKQRDLEAHHLQEAIARMHREPLGVGPDHWVHSTMLRRKLAAMALRAPEDADAYVQAVVALRQGLDRLSSTTDELYRREYQRRINNLVYYASRVIALERDPGSLAKCGLTRSEFDRYRDMLKPDGIEKVQEPFIVHTLGYAHHVLRELEEQRTAAIQLKQLVLTAESDDAKQELELLRDANNWLADARWSIVQDSGSASIGFREPADPFDAHTASGPV